MQDNYKKNWQLPVEIIEYVKEEFNLVGSIDVFDIYEK